MEEYLTLESEFASTTAAMVSLLMDEEATLSAEEEAAAASTASYWDNSTAEPYATMEVPPKRDSLLIVVPITILYSAIFFTGVVGNFVTCVVIARNKHMHTATNYYLFSLAVSDLLLLVSGLPQEMYSIWSNYPYIFGEVFCVLRGFAAETSTNASVLTITAFTVERYVAICHPFQSHTMSKLSRAVKFIVAIWLVAMASAVPQAIQLGLVYDDRVPELVQCMVARDVLRNSFEVSTFLFFVAPMTLITVLYALIGLRLRRSGMQRGAGSFGKKRAASAHDGSHAELAGKRSCSGRHQPGQSKKVLKMLVAVVVAFFICWAPFHAQRLVATLGSKTGSNQPVMRVIYNIVTYVSGILYYVSTTINPILYHIMSLKFREAFKDTLARCCGMKARRKRRSYSVLSRSGHRRCLAAAAACVAPSAQESTDCSGNSVREEYLATAVTTSGGGPSCVRGRSAGGGSVRTDSVEFHRCYSVVVVASASTQGSAQGLTPPYGRQDTQSSQRPLLSASRWRRGRGRASLLWKVLGCVPGGGDAARPTSSLAYAPAAGAAGHRESFNLLPVAGSHSASEHSVATSNSNNVSNSSLRDVERGALEDELTTYMEELHRRQRC